MPEVSATDASRRFADLLDAVEHRGETFTIVRRGKVIAQLEPARTTSGARAKELIRHHRVDAEWIGEVAELRSQLVAEDRF
ncbi:MAG TPA: type II toxin-antitoxin system prevent-host-death family antitoxin [Ilumatobacteraceae bacterium]